MKRSIDTSIWGDPWFTELSAEGKMVFMYLLTNERSTAAGIFDLSPRRMAFDIGIDQSVATSALKECEGRVRWWPEHSIVWVINFFRHQAVNDNFLKSAQRTYADLPEEIRKEVVREYPEFDTNPSGTPPEPVGTGTQTPTHIANSNELRARSREGTDTPKPPKAKPAKAKTPESTAPNGTEVVDTPFALFESMCEQTGVEPAEVPKADKNKNLAVAKRLAESGTTAKDVADITRWLQSQTWRTGGVDMFTIEKERMRWQTAGKPDGSKPTPLRKPPANLQTNKEREDKSVWLGDWPEYTG